MWVGIYHILLNSYEIYENNINKPENSKQIMAMTRFYNAYVLSSFILNIRPKIMNGIHLFYKYVKNNCNEKYLFMIKKQMTSDKNVIQKALAKIYIEIEPELKRREMSLKIKYYPLCVAGEVNV